MRLASRATGRRREFLVLIPRSGGKFFAQTWPVAESAAAPRRVCITVSSTVISARCPSIAKDLARQWAEQGPAFVVAGVVLASLRGRGGTEHQRSGRHSNHGFL